MSTYFTAIKKAIGRLPNAEDYTLSQMRDGYSIGYRPKYPEKTAADFEVFVNQTKGTISMSGNLYALIPTIKKYTCWADLYRDLQQLAQDTAPLRTDTQSWKDGVSALLSLGYQLTSNDTWYTEFSNKHLCHGKIDAWQSIAIDWQLMCVEALESIETAAGEIKSTERSLSFDEFEAIHILMANREKEMEENHV